MRKIIFSVLALFLITACAKNRVEQLTNRADAYNRSLRWSSLTAASALIADESRGKMIDKLSKLMKSSRIVDYSIVDLGLDSEKLHGSVVVEFSFYNNIDQSMRYRQEIQSWEFDKKQGKWFIKKARTTAIE